MQEPLYLDFEGVANPSSSFLDELLGRLAAQLGAQEFHRRIKIINADSQVVDMARLLPILRGSARSAGKAEKVAGGGTFAERIAERGAAHERAAPPARSAGAVVVESLK